jgi:hypothetical protein
MRSIRDAVYWNKMILYLCEQNSSSRLCESKSGTGFCRWKEERKHLRWEALIIFSLFFSSKGHKQYCMQIELPLGLENCPRKDRTLHKVTRGKFQLKTVLWHCYILIPTEFLSQIRRAPFFRQYSCQKLWPGLVLFKIKTYFTWSSRHKIVVDLCLHW